MNNVNYPEWASEKQKEGMLEFSKIANEHGIFEIAFEQGNNDDSDDSDDSDKSLFEVALTWTPLDSTVARTHLMTVDFNYEQTWNHLGEELCEWQFVFGSGDCTRSMCSEMFYTDVFFRTDALLSTEYKQNGVNDLKAIGEVISKQDNRSTDQPLFIVEEKERIYGMAEGYAEDYHWINEADEYAVATYKQANTLDKLDERKCSCGELGDWKKVHYKEIWVFVTACFTRDGCQNYINLNYHNHQGEVRIYAKGSFRNEEYQTVRNALIALNKGLE